MNYLRNFSHFLSLISNNNVLIRTKKTYSRPSIKFSKSPKNLARPEQEKKPNEDEDNIAYDSIARRTFRVSDMGHNVLVIQPYIKWGPKKITNTTPELQLQEAVALVGTLREWSVVDKRIVPLMNFDKLELFGSGNLEELRNQVEKDERISAVFISINILKGVQRATLERVFQVPIFDRYSIVIQILKEHAISWEAKLQIKLAEIPYLKSRLKSELTSGEHASAAGGETPMEFRLNVLKQKERQIKEEIKQVRAQRGLIRKRREKMEMGVVAVVGYTNAGKTCLIKALTGQDKILPQNHLFATLDITMHAGILPCSLKILYADTIGFMRDLPTGLLECFTATLDDALSADVIIHVRDASHPDAKAQNDHVNNTLLHLISQEMPLDHVITVANKIDLVDKIDKMEFSNCIQVSAIKGTGMEELLTEIENKILIRTNRCRMGFKVRQASPEYQWLRKETAVCCENLIENQPDFTLIEVIISDTTLAKFKHKFIYCLD